MPSGTLHLPVVLPGDPLITGPSPVLETFLSDSPYPQHNPLKEVDLGCKSQETLCPQIASRFETKKPGDPT